MRREPHPISGAIYAEVGDGVVRVEDRAKGKSGLFRYDGTWIEGDLTHADPHLLQLIGGPDLPPGKDLNWMLLPPVEGASAEIALQAAAAMDQQPRIIAPYTNDPGMPTPEGTRSAAYVPLDYFLEHDRRPELMPEVFRRSSPMPGGPRKVKTARYHEKAFHDLEVERLWKKTWQMVCREDDIPNVGDYHVYTVSHLSYLVVRTGEREFKAHVNACLHRGRQLREQDGKEAREFRCPYHGWSWKIDGALKELSAEWDFPGVREEVCQLPGAKVATWGGFVFINPDPEAIPLEAHMGPEMVEHYRKAKLENRYKHAHVLKVVRANWKVVQEAFLEAYHVIATHPQLLLAGADYADMRCDVFGNWGRLGHVVVPTSSPQRGIVAPREVSLDAYLKMADQMREYLRGLIGDEVEQYSDAEINDGTFSNLFPNFSPWSGWARIVYRFRPNGDNPDEALMDVMLLAPWPEGKPKPPPAKVRRLGPDDSWTEAPEIGSLARIFDQDCGNLPGVQLGLRTKQPDHVWFSGYQESIIRNFHANYERALGIGEDD
jgi:phenylpropionate dioxygenase-like ring-hydroxylating dioxygenase large terminal subunit